MAKTWPQRFLIAIRPGQDLSRVGWQFLHWLLTESGLAEFDHPLVRDVVRQCADVLTPLMDGRPVDTMAAADAASAAWAAVKLADHTVVVPAGVAWSAESAARAAESALLSETCHSSSAERAVTATSSAVAGSTSYTAMSERLLALIALA